MEERDRERRDELQAEAREVAREEIENERVHQPSRALSASDFPSRSSGSDGDSLVVVKGGGVWYCHKVRGRWYRIRMEKA